MQDRLIDRLKSGIFLMDGALGTQLQAVSVPEQDWGGRKGCNEYLNLSRPDIVERVHADNLAAGSDAVETNTFGASPATLGEYDLAGQAREINRAATECARRAADAAAADGRARFVFGSIGPGTKLVSLGQTSFDTLYADYLLQIETMLAAGADGILFETCQDLLQVKAGICAFEDVVAGDRRIPLYVSVTIEETGTMLVGSSIDAVAATLKPYPVTILGLNCATGPRLMRHHLEYLNRYWPNLIAAMPNAGMPTLADGQVVYPLGAQEFAEVVCALASEFQLNVVGGCCGTTPAHIASLSQALADYRPAERNVESVDQASSLFGPVRLDQKPAPLYIGERANATGSRAFRRTLAAGDWDGAFDILSRQEERGAHMVDLNVAHAEGDEVRDIGILAARAARECRLPLMVDTTSAAAAETALKLYGGRAFLNSINFEAGEERALRVARLARRYGAGLVGLTIDEQGMARTADRKLEIARRIVRFCEDQCDIDRGSLFIDSLTFTVASGDESFQNAAVETIESIAKIKDALPGVRIMLGASNISFGLKPPARKIVNAVFLDMAVRAGLDAAIVNVAGLAPLTAIDADLQDLARRLLENDRSAGDPLLRLIEHFEDGGADIDHADAGREDIRDEEALMRNIVQGRMVDEELVARLLKAHSAEDILNEMLMPGMAEVGRLFNDGTLQLPFVLKSAEVMKRTVDLVKPHMRHEDSAARRGRMLLATVAGDVHDIGKNLVDIILSNNGFDVVDLGTKVPVEKILAAIEEHRPDVLGLSGLLVKSTSIMAADVKRLNENGIDIPVFLGGAALTADYVARQCQPEYSGAVIYCRDAFSGLQYLRDYMDSGVLPERIESPSESRLQVESPPEQVSVANNSPVPKPPFIGHRIEREIAMADIYPLLNKRALFRGRWGYRRFRKSDDEYEAMIAREVEPKLQEMIADCERRGIFQPRAAWGYFTCRGAGETLAVDTPDGELKLEFPRRDKAPRIALPDYFRKDEDVVGFMVVTMGERYTEECRRLKQLDEYEKYFLFHGLDAELTDALAMFWHSRMRAELGFSDSEDMTPGDHFKKRYRGARYGFGYAACPDTSMNRICCELVHADEIGVDVTEHGVMIPGVTTAAMIVHNEEAEYL